MYRIGLILGPAVFIVGVIDWIIRLAHFVDLIEKTLPVTGKMTSPTGIWITLIVGILIFLAAWAERKREKDQDAKYRARKPDEMRRSSPSIGNITQTANPVNTVAAGQKIEIHNYPQQPLPTAKKERPIEQVRHSIRFVGLKKTKTDIAREIFDPEDGFVGVKACFLNEVIPGVKTQDFDYVKTRVVVRDASGAEVATTTKPHWLNYGPGDPVHIEVNAAECILLAVYGSDKRWSMPFVSSRPSEYWEDGREKIMVDAQTLPIGELTAQITLVAKDSVGVAPVFVRFALGPDGEFKIKPLQP